MAATSRGDLKEHRSLTTREMSRMLNAMVDDLFASKVHDIVEQGKKGGFTDEEIDECLRKVYYKIRAKAITMAQSELRQMRSLRSIAVGGAAEVVGDAGRLRDETPAPF